MVKRIKLKDRILPDYTRGEEIFNMVSHIVGGGFGLIALATCVVKAFMVGNAYDIVGAFIYGLSMVILYTMSSLYHGLKPVMAKKVFQVLDHCTIFALIAGTYTPIALSGIRPINTALGWTVFGVVWGVTALGITLNAIDLKRYNVLSMVLYIALGWCIILTGPTAIKALGEIGMNWMLAGGISYTVGAVFYGVAGHGKKPHRYIHSVFHLFVVLGSILQYVGIILYII
ncbi:MAG: hemolysin III family protein [Clostridia bacterium]|nr:hemolysin III family protein [Clostridia bacterium]